jgi:hypothetical protein
MLSQTVPTGDSRPRGRNYSIALVSKDCQSRIELPTRSSISIELSDPKIKSEIDCSISFGLVGPIVRRDKVDVDNLFRSSFI